MDISITDTYIYLLFVFMALFVFVSIIMGGYSMTRQKIDITKYVVEDSLDTNITVDGDLDVANTLEVDSAVVQNGVTTVHELSSANQIKVNKALVVGSQIIDEDDATAFVNITEWVSISYTTTFGFSIPASPTTLISQVDTSQILDQFAITGTKTNMFTYKNNPPGHTVSLFTLDRGAYLITLNCLGSISPRPTGTSYFLDAQLVAYDPSIIYYNITTTNNEHSNIIDSFRISLDYGVGFSFSTMAYFPYSISQNTQQLTANQVGLQFTLVYSKTGLPALSSKWNFTKLDLTVNRVI